MPSKEPIQVTPIGVTHTTYHEHGETPIQGAFKPEGTGWVEVFPEYREGLKDIEGFSHLFLIYLFHRTSEVKLVAAPFLETTPHGIFAIRGPMRPNHLGLSVVRLERVEGHRLDIAEVDMLDGTPLLDIKPYVSHFDRRDNVRCGWVDKQFEDGVPPHARRKDSPGAGS